MVLPDPLRTKWTGRIKQQQDEKKKKQCERGLLYIYNKKKIQIFGMNMPFISSSEAR